MRTEKVHEVKIMHADLEALRAHRDQALRLKKTKTDEQAKAQAIEEAIRDAEAQMNVRSVCQSVLHRDVPLFPCSPVHLFICSSAHLS